MAKKLDLTGEKYGRLYVEYESPERIQKKITWVCRCDCGNIVKVTTHALRSGNTSSCGCLKKDKLIERNLKKGTVQIGNVYGKLTVIKDLGLRKQNSRDKNWRWSLCKCECGNEIEVPNNLLQNGWKKSCGCLQSQGEFVIEKILKENQQNYIKEYSFTDLKGSRGGKLRFDFAVFENNTLSYLIEFDGRQHYTGPEATWTQGHSLEEIQLYDNIKNEYCYNNNIILKRIPYYDIKNLTFDNIISNKYNINKKETQV